MEVAEVRVKYKPGKKEYNWILKSCEFCAVPWYVKIYVKSRAWETNKQTKRWENKRRGFIYNIAMIQMCGENGWKWTSEVRVNERSG